MDQEQLKNALVYAADARKAEIALLWSRSLYFWGFVAVALASYSASFNGNRMSFAVLAGCVGWVISICWSLANRSSKFWQETWEKKADAYAYELLGERIFTDNARFSIQTKGWLAPKRFSVSKLAMAISDMFCFLWMMLTLVPYIIDIKSGVYLLDTLSILVTATYTFYMFQSCLTDV